MLRFGYGMLAVCVALVIGTPTAWGQVDYYWNGANTSASPAAGGTGTWDAANAWRTVSSSGSQGTWTGTNNNAFLEGTAGTITLGTTGTVNYQGTNLTVNTSGYSITTSTVNRTTAFSGTLSLANSVTLTLTNSNTGGNLNTFGTISFGTGSSLNIQGGASGSNANRVTLSAAGTTSGGSINLSGTGTGVTGFTSGVTIAAGGATINSDITNNSSTSATMLGASTGNLLTYGGILSGSANLQISNGQSGGAGIVVLNNTNNFTGDTYLNTASSGVTRIGVNNALPSGTTVFFGTSAGGGTADTGGSIDLNGRDLTVGALDGSASTRGVANNTSSLSTLTIGKASGSNTFAGNIGTVTNSNLATQTNNIALVKTGASTQILTNANTYTGSTTINAGVLSVSALANGGSNSNIGASTNAASNLVFGGGTLRYTGSTTSTNRNFTLTDGTTSNIEVTTVSANVTTTGAAASTTGALTKLGSGTLTLSGANAFTGATTISAGTLALSSTGSISSSSSITVNGTGIYNVTAVTNYALAGTQTLSGASGTVNGSVIVGTGRTVQGGNTATPVGTLNFNNNLTLASGGTLGVRINSAGTAAAVDSGTSSTGSNNNFSNIAGSMTINGGSLFSVNGADAIFTHGAIYSYVIADATNNLSGLLINTQSQFNFTNINTGGLNDFRLVGDNNGRLIISFTAVPEPGLLFGLSVGLLAVAGVVRKRLRS